MQFKPAQVQGLTGLNEQLQITPLRPAEAPRLAPGSPVNFISPHASADDTAKHKAAMEDELKEKIQEMFAEKKEEYENKIENMEKRRKMLLKELKEVEDAIVETTAKFAREKVRM